mmetsp:Transcript_85136/g.237597  ORF Transcript_85136/g.237597 Transcript_85136/m.237597 type:complete len:297 (-) Transcript_85136:127-1017(-)
MSEVDNMAGSHRHVDALTDRSRDTVRFNVGGRIFEVMPHVIKSRGATLLANLMDDIETDRSRPIFVDANPDRFTHILDWYRHGEMYVADNESIQGLLRDARYFMLPDLVKINGESHSIQGYVAAEVHEVMRKAVVGKWPNFRSYLQRLIAEIKKNAELLGDRSGDVDTDVFDNSSDMASENASTLAALIPQRSLESKRTIISKEIVLAEVGRLDDSESNLLEVQSMAPMFMFNEVPPPPRWRWTDEQNVCNELRLRVLKSELERMGFNCTISWPRSREHGLQRLVLRIELKILGQL